MTPSGCHRLSQAHGSPAFAQGLTRPLTPDLQVALAQDQGPRGLISHNSPSSSALGPSSLLSSPFLPSFRMKPSRYKVDD